MDRVARRDFLHSPGKLIKEGKFILTNRGVDEYMVSIDPVEEVKGGEEKVVPIKTKEEAVERVKEYVMEGMKYGCGCVKVEGKNLCGKHGRV